MNKHQLEYFIAIVEHSSFTRAAASLNVAQPSLSRAMKGLERELGIELFRRTGRDIIVTDVAWELARRARMIVHQFDAFAAAAQERAGAVGRVDVATTPSTSIEPLTTVVDTLRLEHPGLTVTGVPTQNSAEVVAAVDKGLCEVGLCGQLSTPVGEHISATHIGHDEVVLVTPPDSPLKAHESVSADDLRGQRFVVAPRTTTLRSVFEQVVSEAGEHSVAVEVGHRESIVPMVLRGVGVALHVREWTRLAEQAGAGVISLEPAVFVPKWLVCHRSLSEPARAFAEAVSHIAEGTTLD